MGEAAIVCLGLFCLGCPASLFLLLTVVGPVVMASHKEQQRTLDETGVIIRKPGQ